MVEATVTRPAFGSSATGALLAMRSSTFLLPAFTQVSHSRRVEPPQFFALRLGLGFVQHAQVFVVPFGGGTGHPQMLEGLSAAAGFLRGEVGRRVGLRHAPRLQFVQDDSFDRAAELTALINSANKPRS